MTDKHCQVLIVGGGSAGISIAARICARPDAPEVTIVEPSDKHYYQPLWTLVGAGVFPKEESERNEGDFIPSGAKWIKSSVKSFEPDSNAVVLNNGERLTYGDLVVTLGIQLDYDKIEGLPEALGRNGICSNYRYDTVETTWAAIKAFKGGNAIFTYPNTPIKCAGAPQKIMYLAEESFRNQGVRDKTKVVYACAGGAIFGIAKYRAALEDVVKARDIDTRFNQNLVKIDADKKTAVFADVQSGEHHETPFDMIHVTPPQSDPTVIKESALAIEGPLGWVDVDKHTLRHNRFDNVWSAGDCSSLPCSKTGAAVRKQVPVLVENLMAKRASRPLRERYNGYASCPLVTSRGTVILAEFDYDGNPTETFDVDQAKERYSMYALKAYGLPRLYWHGMLRGRL